MDFLPMAKIDLMSLSSMGLRMTPANRQPLQASKFFELESTSAESNVLNISASLGLNTKVLTKFVAHSPMADFIKAELRRRNIRYEGSEQRQEGPWGIRHQINFADSGYGLRAPLVYNDRAGEVGRTISSGDFDFKRLFRDEKCRLLHLSGLIAALSPETGECCLSLVKAAKEAGTKISFDLNHRASFWQNRNAELATLFKEIASLADILIGNEEDYQLCLCLEGPEAGGSDLNSKIESFQLMIEQAAVLYPDVAVFATTLREVESANLHHWGAILRADARWYVEAPRPIPVLDRIGGGDAFVGGLLYGLLKNWEAEYCLKFAWASGALAVTLSTDYASPCDEAQVWEIYKGNARIVR